jgi:hypothetical protein
MGRKLVEATNACRIRRTRGETVLLRALAECRFAAPDALFAGADDLFALVLFAGDLLLAFLTGLLLFLFPGVGSRAACFAEPALPL